MEYQRQPDQQEQKQQYGGVGLAGKGAKEHNPGVVLSLAVPLLVPAIVTLPF